MALEALAQGRGRSGRCRQARQLRVPRRSPRPQKTRCLVAARRARPGNGSSGSSAGRPRSATPSLLLLRRSPHGYGLRLDHGLGYAYDPQAHAILVGMTRRMRKVAAFPCGWARPRTTCPPLERERSGPPPPRHPACRVKISRHSPLKTNGRTNASRPFRPESDIAPEGEILGPVFL